MKGPATEPSSDAAAWPGSHRATRLLAWLAGALGLGVVIVVAFHLSEGREFVRIAEHVEPWWLFTAALLQTMTYLSEGSVWRGVASASGFPLALRTACRLSVAKLFVNQALPSTVLSGTFVAARSLEQMGLTRPAVVFPGCDAAGRLESGKSRDAGILGDAACGSVRLAEIGRCGVVVYGGGAAAADA